MSDCVALEASKVKRTLPEKNKQYYLHEKHEQSYLVFQVVLTGFVLIWA